jgi:hypothetical protein
MITCGLISVADASSFSEALKIAIQRNGIQESNIAHINCAYDAVKNGYIVQITHVPNTICVGGVLDGLHTSHTGQVFVTDNDQTYVKKQFGPVLAYVESRLSCDDVMEALFKVYGAK